MTYRPHCHPCCCCCCCCCWWWWWWCAELVFSTLHRSLLARSQYSSSWWLLLPYHSASASVFPPVRLSVSQSVSQSRISNSGAVFCLFVWFKYGINCQKKWYQPVVSVILYHVWIHCMCRFLMFCFSVVCFFIYVSFRAVVSASWAFLSSRHSSVFYCFAVLYLCW